MKMTYAEKIEKVVEKHCDGREIVIWGAGNYAKKYEEIITSRFGTVSFFVDSDRNKVNGTYVRDPEVLKGKSEQYFVCVSVQRYIPEISEALSCMGYILGKDYVYIAKSIKDVTNYQDEFGNRIEGNIEGAEVYFQGCNSVLYVGNDVKFKNVKLYINSDCSIKIGNRVNINERGIETISRWHFRDASVCHIDDKVSFFGDGVLNCAANSYMNIGKGTTIEYNYHMAVGSSTSMIIGRDCMISYDFVSFSSDGHPIFDLDTGEVINVNNQGYNVILHNHVWIGYRVTLLKGTEIGTGCVVGANSLVTKSFPNNCILAGNPAKVLRENIAWNQRAVESMYDIPQDYLQHTNRTGE